MFVTAVDVVDVVAAVVFATVDVVAAAAVVVDVVIDIVVVVVLVVLVIVPCSCCFFCRWLRAELSEGMPKPIYTWQGPQILHTASFVFWVTISNGSSAAMIIFQQRTNRKSLLLKYSIGGTRRTDCNEVC